MNAPITASMNLKNEEWKRMRLRAIFEHCKWDPQCGDHSVLGEFALLLEPATVAQLARFAEQLSREAFEAENEIYSSPLLLARLAIPKAIRKCFDGSGAEEHARHVRVMRFDFHFTTKGWQISEVNADVPGGYVEGSGWSELFSEHLNGFVAADSPTKAYVDAICEVAPHGGVVALAHATVYSEDRQEMVHLGRELHKRGRKPMLISPGDLSWKDEEANVAGSAATENPAVIVRRSPAEWLPEMCNAKNWQPWFENSATALSNPGKAIVLQSKRFPLIWNELRAELPVWREMLPKTWCPSEFERLEREDLVVKPAFGRVGEDVAIQGVTESARYAEIVRAARKKETQWVVQERFEVVPVPSESGEVFPCIGVYTVNGKMAGLYGRAAQRALIDQDAYDVAVLVRDENKGRAQ